MSRKGKPAPPPPPAPALPGAVLAAWAALVLVVFLRKAPLQIEALPFFLSALAGGRYLHPYIGKAALALGLALWIAAAATATGAAALRRWSGAPFTDRLERWTLGAAAGLGFVSLLTLLLGLAGLWLAPLFWALLIAGTAILLLERGQPPFERGLPPFEPFAAVTAVALAVVAFGDLTPEIFFDANYYHLGFPNVYRLEGRIVNLPLVYANFIQAVQMVWGFALTLGNELTTKWLHGLTAALTGLAFVAFARRWLSPGAGWIAAALYLSMPVIAMNAGTSGMDVAWAFFHFASAYALARALTEPAWLLPAGFLTGLSASCKYQGYPFAPIACLLLLWSRREDGRPWREAWLDTFKFAAAALVPLVPYLAKNVAFHGNPLYPFGGTSFGTPLLEPERWGHVIADAPARKLAAEFATFESAKRFILHPWYMAMEGRSSSDFVGPLMLAFGPALLLMRPAAREARLLLRYSLALWALWLLTTSTPRYLLPVFAMLAPLAAEAVLLATRGTAWRSVCLALLAAGALGSAWWGWVMIWTSEGWKVVAGITDVHRYLGEMHPTYPTPSYEGIRWMNENLPADARVMFLGDSRSFPMDRRHAPNSVYDPQTIERLARGAKDGDEVAARAKAEGFTHVFLNFAEMMRTDPGYQIFRWDRPAFEAAEDFWGRWLDPVWKAEDGSRERFKLLYVYVIRSEPRAKAEGPGPLSRFAPK